MPRKHFHSIVLEELSKKNGSFAISLSKYDGLKISNWTTYVHIIVRSCLIPQRCNTAEACLLNYRKSEGNINELWIFSLRCDICWFLWSFTATLILLDLLSTLVTWYCNTHIDQDSVPKIICTDEHIALHIILLIVYWTYSLKNHKYLGSHNRNNKIF